MSLTVLVCENLPPGLRPRHERDESHGAHRRGANKSGVLMCFPTDSATTLCHHYYLYLKNDQTREKCLLDVTPSKSGRVRTES